MRWTRATDIHFKNNSNESSRFLLDNEHQDVVNVTPDTVLEGSIYRIRFNYLGPIPYNFFFFIPSRFHASSETQGQILRARESLDGRENMARRKVKNGVKKLGRKTQTFSGTNQKAERRRPSGTGLVRHCPQGLFSPFFTFLRVIFFRPFRLSLALTICPWVSDIPLAIPSCFASITTPPTLTTYIKGSKAGDRLVFPANLCKHFPPISGELRMESS